MAVYYNCLFTGNSSVYGGGGACDGVFYNCVAVNNSSGIRYGYIYNSIMRDNSANDYPQAYLITNSCASGLAGNNNISDNPLFVSATNFRLQAGSPCVNKGANMPWMTDGNDLRSKDMVGNPRIINGVVDMGAYESPYVALPSVPASVSASDGQYTDRIRITWLVASGATSYQVFRCMSNHSDAAGQIGVAASTTFDDSGAVAGTTYYYWVKAVNSSGTSAFSASDVGYLGSSVATLNVPTRVSASDGAYSNLVRVTWSAVTNALYYELWRNTSNSSVSASFLAQTTNGLTYDDATVVAGVTYCYWVKAKNAQTVSAFSDPDGGYAAMSTVSGYANLEVSDVILLPITQRVGGHPGAVGLQLMNWGPSDMVAPNTRLILDFFLSKNTSFGDADDLWLGEYKTDVTLPAGCYAMVAVTAAAREGFTVPEGAVGTNYVFARVRHTYPSTLGDSDESNNYAMRSGAIVVTAAYVKPTAGYHLINDYDGDGKSDLALYKEVTGEWLVMLSGDGYAPVQFVLGGMSYQPVIADYDGDGKADPAVCNQKTGDWKAVLSASSNSLATFNFGGHAEIPVPIDYDGDGKADPAIYQQSGSWAMLMSGANYAMQTMLLGGNNDLPVPADYDGDGISDLAVYRASTGDWALKLSTLDYWTVAFQFGGAGAIPVPADYDGDGKTDPAVYKESSGDWSVMMSRFDYITAGATFGGHDWAPVAADYDGDGKEDVAIYNDNQHLLKVLVSGNGYGLTTMDVGSPGYEPVGWSR